MQTELSTARDLLKGFTLQRKIDTVVTTILLLPVIKERKKKTRQDKTNLFHRSVTARSRKSCERSYGRRVKQTSFCQRRNLDAIIMIGFHYSVEVSCDTLTISKK